MLRSLVGSEMCIRDRYEQALGKTPNETVDIVHGINFPAKSQDEVETEIITEIIFDDLEETEIEQVEDHKSTETPSRYQQISNETSENIWEPSLQEPSRHRGKENQKGISAAKTPPSLTEKESPAPKTTKESPERNLQPQSHGEGVRQSYKDTVMRNVDEEPEGEIIMDGNIKRSLTLWLPDAISTESLVIQIAESLKIQAQHGLIGVERDTRVKSANKYTLVMASDRAFNQASNNGVTINGKHYKPQPPKPRPPPIKDLSSDLI